LEILVDLHAPHQDGEFREFLFDRATPIRELRFKMLGSVNLENSKLQLISFQRGRLKPIRAVQFNSRRKRTGYFVDYIRGLQWWGRSLRGKNSNRGIDDMNRRFSSVLRRVAGWSAARVMACVDMTAIQRRRMTCWWIRHALSSQYNASARQTPKSFKSA
jgi:hypothetical protein